MQNLEFLYKHLPTRFQRGDKDLFLKRFLQFFGETLDNYDLQFDEFFRQIDPATARIEFVTFWLQQLFDWNWFPRWFSDADKRRLYGNMARHLARRGTTRGIKEWLADFYIESVVHKSPQFYEQAFYGEPLIFVTQPLVLIVEIGKIAPPNYREDISIFSDSFYEEAFYSEVVPLYLLNEIENLLRHVQPHSQEIVIYNNNQYFEESAPAPDVTPPTVTDIGLSETPAAPGYYTGTINFNVAATDNVAVNYIQVFIAGSLFTTIYAASGTVNWNTANTSATGSTQSIEVKAKAFDYAGNPSAFLTKNVPVQNAAPVFTNWALASNGSTATALNYNANLLPDRAINGNRTTQNNWNGATNDGSGWDGGCPPDNWLVVDFGVSRTIVEIDVFTLADAINYSVVPTLTDTFFNYGIVDFIIQYWNGASWVDIQSITGNNKLWRQFTFSAITTQKIRVYVTAALGNSARIVELEAWGL